MDWAKTTGRGEKKYLSFGIWCDLYKRFYGSCISSYGIQQDHCNQARSWCWHVMWLFSTNEMYAVKCQQCTQDVCKSVGCSVYVCFIIHKIVSVYDISDTFILVCVVVIFHQVRCMYRGIWVSFIETCLVQIDIKWPAWQICHSHSFWRNLRIYFSRILQSRRPDKFSMKSCCGFNIESYCSMFVYIRDAPKL